MLPLVHREVEKKFFFFFLPWNKTCQVSKKLSSAKITFCFTRKSTNNKTKLTVMQQKSQRKIVKKNKVGKILLPGRLRKRIHTYVHTSVEKFGTFVPFSVLFILRIPEYSATLSILFVYHILYVMRFSIINPRSSTQC